MNARALTLPLLAITVVTFGETIQLKAKAVIAQRLIERAWHTSLETGEIRRPWHWADTWPVARLRTDALGRDLFVLAGANGGAFAFGPGHFTHTALPGAAGTSVIAGHRDTHFRFLEALGRGEVIEAQRMDGGWATYIVRERQVVDMRQSDVWTASPARDELHLITCYPFDAVAPGGPLRLVVIAERE